MKRLIKSPWFATILGIAAFVVTLLVVLDPAKLLDVEALKRRLAEMNQAEVNATEEGPRQIEHIVEDDQKKGEEQAENLMELQKVLDNLQAAGDPGQLHFDNPDIKKLVDGLGRQFLDLEQRRLHLEELNQEAARQLAEIGSYTNQVALARAAFEREYNRKHLLITTSQTNRLAELARINESMLNDSEANALRALKLNHPDQIARILYFMSTDNRASVFNNFAADDSEQGQQLLKSIQDSYKQIIIDADSDSNATAGPQPVSTQGP